MNVIPTPVQTILDLFATDLADVRFGDVNAETLAGFAEGVQSAALVVTTAQASLDEARGTLEERKDALLQHAQRALAYARVYAESNAGLTARLDAIALPRATRRARPDADAGALVLCPDPQTSLRPRGRPRKTPVGTPMLDEELTLDALAATGE